MLRAAEVGELVMPLEDRSFDGLEVVSAERDTLMLSMPGASRQLPALFGALDGAGMRVAETTLTQPSLESLFIKLTGRELRE